MPADTPAQQRPSWLSRALLYGGMVCLIAGLCLPFMTVRRFTDNGEESPGFEGMKETLFQKLIELFVPGGATSKSLVGGISLLWAKGQVATALLLLSVSVVFPTAKLATSILLVEAGGRIRGRVRWLLERFGPWSLLDALVLALLVIASQKFPLGTTVTPAVGFYFFILAVVLSTVGVMLTPGGERCPACSGVLDQQPGQTPQSVERPSQSVSQMAPAIDDALTLLSEVGTPQVPSNFKIEDSAMSLEERLAGLERRLARSHRVLLVLIFVVPTLFLVTVGAYLQFAGRIANPTASGNSEGKTISELTVDGDVKVGKNLTVGGKLTVGEVDVSSRLTAMEGLTPIGAAYFNARDLKGATLRGVVQSIKKIEPDPAANFGEYILSFNRALDSRYFVQVTFTGSKVHYFQKDKPESVNVVVEHDGENRSVSVVIFGYANK